MSKIADLNRYRRKHWVRLATDSGWETQVESDEPVAKVWIYSVRLEGQVRAAGQLLQSSVAELRAKQGTKVRKKDIQLAGNAVMLLDEKPHDGEARSIALAALAHYFSRTESWRRLSTQYQQSGLHLIVADWDHPDGGIMLRPSVAMSPSMLSPDELRNCISTLLLMERAMHPERLPVSLR